VVERRSGLGKGLAALIPAETPSGSPASLQDLPVASIEPNPNQPRAHFDEDSLADLAASIRELGVLQPVLVRAAEPGRYRLIAGERRWRAARRAGLDTIPAIVRETDDLGSIEQALVENLHRQDLTALEEAAAYQQLIEDFELTHDDVATRVGKSRVAVTNTLRLLQLPPTIQHLLADGRLTAGHARALLGTPDRGFQETLARRAVDEHLSVRAVEEAVRVHAAGPTRVEGPAPSAPASTAGRQPLRPPGLLELEELLSDYLDTRVSVTMGTGRGKLVVEFATLEDLERIYRLVTEAPERH
jgi:ParB family transcriptional regulator, chromosome partitioning protein